jgi:hypothetical protein
MHSLVELLKDKDSDVRSSVASAFDMLADQGEWHLNANGA